EVARVCSLLIAHAPAYGPLDEALLMRCYPAVAGHRPTPETGAIHWGEASMREALRAFERELMLSRLELHHWNVRSARQSLGLPKTTFHRRAIQLGIPFARQARG